MDKKRELEIRQAMLKIIINEFKKSKSVDNLYDVLRKTLKGIELELKELKEIK